ncbi:MAG TPA: hypothetical protein VE134_03300 [Methanomicrobiales archaeon]|nr:hypothetical protein [Methanomicrobiales archaeon]
MAEYPRREKDRGASAVDLKRPTLEEGRDPQEEAVREEQRLEGSERRPGRPGTQWRPKSDTEERDEE